MSHWQYSESQLEFKLDLDNFTAMNAAIHDPTHDLSPGALAMDARTHQFGLDDFSSDHPALSDAGVYPFDNFPSSHPAPLDAGVYQSDNFSSSHPPPSDAGVYQSDNFSSSHPVAAPLDAGFHLFRHSASLGALALDAGSHSFMVDSSSSSPPAAAALDSTCNPSPGIDARLDRFRLDPQEVDVAKVVYVPSISPKFILTPALALTPFVTITPLASIHQNSPLSPPMVIRRPRRPVCEKSRSSCSYQ